MNFRRLRLPAHVGLFLSVLLLQAGCDEQQVLYTAKSPETIPPVPAQIQAQAPNDDIHAALQSGMAPTGSGATLPAPAQKPFAKNPLDEPVTDTPLRGVVLSIPSRYTSATAPTTMRIAQYDVPPKSGDGEKGELVVFHFGAGQGGGVMENATRWARQFRAADGEPAAPKQFTQGKVGTLTITRLTMEGTYSPAAMGPGMPPAEPRDNWGMEALIIDGAPQGSLFLRLTGPAALVRAESPAIEFIAATARVEEGQAVAAAPSAPAAAAPHDAMHGGAGLSRVDAPGVSFIIPAEWQEEKAASGMRALQFRVPGAAADNDAEFVVFYFGPTGGGTAEDNIDRWIGQVSQPDGSPSKDKARVDKTTVGNFTVSSVLVEGSYSGAMGPMAHGGSTAKEGQALHGVVIEGGPKGRVFLRLTGPAETVRANADVIQGLIQSLMPAAEGS